MKMHFTGLAVAALLVTAPAMPGFAEDAAAPATLPAPAAAGKQETPPPSVPRPSIVPNAAPPASAPVAEESAPRHRRVAHRRWRGYGSYRTAYWEPFPIYWPHLHRNQIHWSRVPWFRF
jgi:hypothetical protein